VVADTDQNLAKAVQVVHTGAAPGGGDTNVPTSILLDGTGKVRWWYRADRFTDRKAAADVLAEIDRVMGGSQN
jgi:hypothetical protein